MRGSITQIVMNDNPVSALTAVAPGSVASVNSRGDEERPRRVDLCKLKGFQMVLLVRILVGFVVSS